MDVTRRASSYGLAELGLKRSNPLLLRRGECRFGRGGPFVREKVSLKHFPPSTPCSTSGCCVPVVSLAGDGVSCLQPLESKAGAVLEGAAAVTRLQVTVGDKGDESRGRTPGVNGTW